MDHKFANIEPVLFICMLNLFYILPIGQQLVYRKVCMQHFNETFCESLKTASQNESKEENMIQVEVAQLDICINIATQLPALFTTLVFGVWSDGVGRKKVLLIAVLGETISAIFYFMSAYYFETPLMYLVVGSVISGIMGNFPVILMAVFAYIADITTSESRTKRITILDALLFIASFISSLSGGLMLQKYGFATVYGLVLVLYVILITYITLFLKESYFPKNTIKLKDVIIKVKVLESISLFTRARNSYYRIRINLFAGCFFILFFQILGIGSVTILYLLHYPLHFQPEDIGYFAATSSAVKFFGALFVTIICIKKLKWNDSSLILLCSLMAVAYGFGLGLSKTKWQVYLATILAAGMGVGNGACRSGLSKLVSANEQGKMCSIVAIMQVISILIASIVCNLIYKATVWISPSFTFYVVSGFTIHAVFLILLLRRYEEKANSDISSGDRDHLLSTETDVDATEDSKLL